MWLQVSRTQETAVNVNQDHQDIIDVVDHSATSNILQPGGGSVMWSVRRYFFEGLTVLGWAWVTLTSIRYSEEIPRPRVRPYAVIVPGLQLMQCQQFLLDEGNVVMDQIWIQLPASGKSCYPHNRGPWRLIWRNLHRNLGSNSPIQFWKILWIIDNSFDILFSTISQCHK